MKKRVLILGAEPNAVGGVSAINKSILESTLIKDRFDISIIPTWSAKRWIITFVLSIPKLLMHKKEYDLFHVDVSIKGSCIRKLLLTRLLKSKKYIIHLHSGGFLNFYNKTSGFVRKNINHMFKGAEKICCVSKAFVNPIIETFGLSDDKVTYIYNGVEVYEREIRKNNERINVLYMGKLIKERGIQDYLDIAKSFEDDNSIKFYVAGNGLNFNWEDYNVEYLGVISGDKKESTLFQTDVLINPVYNESFGISMVECMNHGVCVIGRRTGSIPEILMEGYCGFLFDDSTEAKKIVTDLISNRVRLREMQKKAYERSLDFPLKRFYENIVMLYEDCI